MMELVSKIQMTSEKKHIGCPLGSACRHRPHIPHTYTHTANKNVVLVSQYCYNKTAQLSGLRPRYLLLQFWSLEVGN